MPKRRLLLLLLLLLELLLSVLLLVPVLPLRAPALYQGVHEEHRRREPNRDARCSLSPGQLA